ncbi:hypothetical protein ACQEUU_37045 [Nonomuraea sp. CA-218870]|uniref:hypothetical protein n=1 Tax=Nonomuraea sp. CA-218870 TaxID=3239998 RepID=UPI003D8C1FD8
MTFFEQLTFWILLINGKWNGLFLPAVAVVAIVLAVCAHLAVWDRIRGRRD